MQTNSPRQQAVRHMTRTQKAAMLAERIAQADERERVQHEWHIFAASRVEALGDGDLAAHWAEVNFLYPTTGKSPYRVMIEAGFSGEEALRASYADADSRDHNATISDARAMLASF